MDQDLSMSSWQGQLPDETMAAHDRPDEFTDLLDFDFDFSTLDNVVPQSGHASMPTSSAQMQMQSTACMDPIQTTQPSSYAEMQLMDSMQVQQQQQQSLVPPGYGQTQAFIPPTPNSMEMHGRAHNYPMRIETETRRIYEPYTRGTDDQSAFTPLMSPAMTPLEQQYRLPEYTIPGECFTPLTSPALEGRNPNNNNFFFNNPSQQLDMNFVSSPMEFPAHMASAPASSSPGAIRKHRRKMSLQSRAGTRLVRQSPSNSQQRQQIASGLSEEPHSPANTPASRSSLFVQLSSDESSGQDSLAEPLMPPPALPRANGKSPHKSPHITTQESEQAPQSTQVAIAPTQSATPAATPATLMRLQKQQHQDPSQTPFSRSDSVVVNDAADEDMEDISLLEPASGSLQSTMSNKSPTPRQTPAPASARPGSASAGRSPQIGAMSSPAGPVGLKRADSKQPSTRTTKKRQSTSTHSAQISPALRPKMSPSLKPLIKGTSDTDMSALYLASKSNYQHILEGTVLPGVSYPNSLAENLSSKRTNHKLAEQGRRNRMNTALKEIEGLLPPSLAQAQTKEAGDANGTNGASKSPDKPSSSQPISKASTVEMAIVYIKSLRQEVAETKGRLKVAEDKLLREKDGGVQQPSNPASPSESDQQASATETTTTKIPDAARSPAEAVFANSEPARAAE